MQTRTGPLLAMLPLAALLMLPLGCGDKQPAEVLRVFEPTSFGVLPFGGPADWTGDGETDGLMLLVQPRDAFGDPLKAVGGYRVELYRWLPATGDPKGEQLAIWAVEINDKGAQEDHWDTIKHAYRFHLPSDLNFRPGQRYQIEISYLSPWEERQFVPYTLTIDQSIDGGTLVRTAR